MSDITELANAAARLAPAASQLPVSWYFDEKLFELEKRLLFEAGPGYVGHELMVPEVHDYRSLEWLDHAKLLVRQEADGDIELLSNVCRHRQAIMLSGYKLDRVEMHQCNYNWKTFIEVYLEDYHVVPYHPGLGNFVTCDDLTWQFGEWYSVQRVGVTPLQKSGSAAYARWQKALLDYYRGEKPRQGAVWLTYYPNIMVEWYPHVLVVSTLIPQDVHKTLNVVEFYYPEDIALFERELIEAEQSAYMETATALSRAAPVEQD